MIPRLLFQGWVGQSPMPDREQAWVKEMGRMNPTWKHVVFGNEMLDQFSRDVYVKALIDQKKPWAFVCDRIRVLLIQEQGGVWLDPDCQPLRPLDSIAGLWDSPTISFAAAYRSPDRPEVALHRGVSLVDNTFLASSPHSRMINRIADLWRPSGIVVDGHAVGCEVLRSADVDVCMLGYKYFYATHRHPETVALHDSHNLASWVESTKNEQRAQLRTMKSHA